MLLFPVPIRHISAQHSMIYSITYLSFRHLLDFYILSHCNKGVSYKILLQWYQMPESSTVKDVTVILRGTVHVYHQD